MLRKHIFIVGPGGVGKTTSGRLLAVALGVPFVDLDSEFMARVAPIGPYIQEHGYEKYCYTNSDLFSKLLKESSEPGLFVLSSGFLVHEGLDDLTEKHRNLLKSEGVSITLLPSESLEESTEIVVQRQLARGFELKEEKERKKFSERYQRYRQEGDVRIFSLASPQEIAEEMKSKLENLAIL